MVEAVIVGQEACMAETSADGLVKVDQVGLIVPRVFIADKLGFFESALRLEMIRTVFVKECDSGRTSWAAS